MLHPELELLLEIQDLQTLRRDVATQEYVAVGIPLDQTERAERLEERINERETQLSPRTRTVYDRVAHRHDRVVAPVIHGVCYGCFVQVPTSRGHDKERNTELRTCESCGRFIYYTD
jgi:predicted  nucleic acid-binding Zn-ribbon protein